MASFLHDLRATSRMVTSPSLLLQFQLLIFFHFLFVLIFIFLGIFLYVSLISKPRQLNALIQAFLGVTRIKSLAQPQLVFDQVENR